MSTFYFTYEFSQGEHILADVGGECTVCDDGTLEPRLYGSRPVYSDDRSCPISNFVEELITPKGPLLSDVLIYLQRKYADRIADIRQDQADERARRRSK